MTFRALPENLHALAEIALRHFSREYGIQPARFKIENEISSNIGYRPTFFAQKNDHTLVGAEISDIALPVEIQALILGCKNNVIPLKLWIVVPYDGLATGIRPSDMHFIKENGVGLLELHLDGRSRQLAGPPLSLSLTGLRSLRFSDYPARYRDDMRTAYDTFTAGNPSKGCSLVYDELENLTRKILKKAQTRGWLRSPVNFNPDTESWSNVLTFLRANFNRTASSCPGMSEALMNRLQGLTEYRNETGHKPKSLKKLMERDRKLRTRFESAADELQSLIEASKSMRP